MAEIPDSAKDLLEGKFMASLGTTRPGGAPQVNPMWFVWDGEFVWFTHTNKRQKFKNLSAEPRVSISIFDAEQPYRYLEIRGVVDHIDEDPEAKMYQQLSERYTGTPETPADAADRVAIAVKPTSVHYQG